MRLKGKLLRKDLHLFLEAYDEFYAKIWLHHQLTRFAIECFWNWTSSYEIPTSNSDQDLWHCNNPKMVQFVFVDIN